MRIIGGKFKGRRFHPPADKWPTRPTTDYAREALLNILLNAWELEGLHILDLFGGTGAVSFELLSRGVREVTYVEQYGPCVNFVKQTAQELELTEQLHIHRAEVFKFLQGYKGPTFDVIFADPPYALPKLSEIPTQIFSNKSLLRSDGWLIIEHDDHHDFTTTPFFLKKRNYGKTLFSIFETSAAE